MATLVQDAATPESDSKPGPGPRRYLRLAAAGVAVAICAVAAAVAGLLTIQPENGRVLFAVASASGIISTMLLAVEARTARRFAELARHRAQDTRDALRPIVVELGRLRMIERETDRINAEIALNRRLLARLSRTDATVPAEVPRSVYWQIYSDILEDLGGLGGAGGLKPEP
jgi:hypothetical protein